MKRLRYRILTAMILLCIGGVFAVTVWAESTATILPVSEAAIQEEPIEEILPHIETPPPQLTNPEKAEAEEPSHNEVSEAVDADALPDNAEVNKPGETAGLETDADAVSGSAEDKTADLETQTTDAAQETVLGTVYADNSNFQAVLQKNPETVIITEPIVWDEPFDSGAPENTTFSTDTPVEVVLGEHSITIVENSRLSFSGPFHFIGAGNLFQIGGDFFLDGARLTSNGDETTAITFSDALVPDGAVTRVLELSNCELSVQGLDSVGVRAAPGAAVRMTNTSVICAGEKCTGVIGAVGSTLSIYEQSWFKVTGKNAVGIMLPEQTSLIGFLEFDITVSGESSRGSVVSSGNYTNSGTVTVSGDKAVGIYLEESAYKAEAGKIVVTGAESAGIFAESNLEVSQLSLTAKTGIAAEADGVLTFILCDIDTPSGGLVSCVGEIVLDTCLISEVPDGAVVKTRKAQPYLNGYETPEGDFLTYEMGVFGFSVPAGSERLTLPDTLTFSLYDEEDAAVRTIERILSVTWEQTDYDPYTVGDYEISYRAEAGGLPMEIAGTVTVHVYDSSRPRLNYALRMGDDYTELYFAPRVEDEEQIQLWVSDDNGETWRDYIAEGKAQAWGRLGFVATDELEENTAYLLKLEIVGGLHAGTSPVLTYWRNQREIKWSNGDRDGGDQRPQEEWPEPETHPKPKPDRPSSSGSHSRPGGIIVLPSTETQTPQEPESQPAFIESLPEEKPFGGVELTQLELEDIIGANPETVTVVSGGVKAELPTDALKAILLEPNESLSILLEQPEENAFDIRIYAGDREIDALGDAPVKVTVPNSGDAKQVVPQMGGDPIPTEKAEDDKIAFSLPKMGTYIMDTSPAKQETETPNTKSFIWIWLSGVSFIGILLFVLCLILRKTRASL